MAFHFINLGSCRCAFFHAHDQSSGRVVANKHHVVDTGAPFESCGKVTLEIGEGTVETCEDTAACPAGLNVRIDGNSGKAAVTGDDSGNTLCHLESHLRVAEECTIVMRVGINKPRCQRLPSTIDFLPAGRDTADLADAAAFYTYISDEGRAAQAVQDGCMTDYDVIHLMRPLGFYCCWVLPQMSGGDHRSLHEKRRPD